MLDNFTFRRAKDCCGSVYVFLPKTIDGQKHIAFHSNPLDYEAGCIRMHTDPMHMIDLGVRYTDAWGAVWMLVHVAGEIIWLADVYHEVMQEIA